jgi:AraC-like DNA-binding protein
VAALWTLNTFGPSTHAKTPFPNKVRALALAGIPVLDLITRIHQEMQGQARDYPLAVKTYVSQILLVLSRYYGVLNLDDNSDDAKVADLERLRKVVCFLRNSYHEKLTLGQVAKVACMSSSYFCRFFKRVTGDSLTTYVLRLRIDRSIELLLNTDKSVAEIAYEVGFDSHRYFDRIFRRFRGRPPLGLARRQIVIDSFCGILQCCET